MDIQDILTPGDKIDIQLMAEAETAGDGISARLYKSSVMDFISDTELEIGMPSYNGKMVLFHVGLRVELVFYTKKGLYTCTALVLDRYRRGNLYMISVDVKSGLKKFQRREFYRIDCYLEMEYFKIDREVADLPKTQLLYKEITSDKYRNAEKGAVALDISGGGMRFVTTEKLEANSYVLVKIQLSNDKIDQIFFLVTEIVDSIPTVNDPSKYQNRGKFRFKEMKDRETIVRYVFEEERRIRNKMGF